MSTGMRRGWQLTGLVMFVICLVTLWEARNLALFDRLGPAAGFFPFYLGLIGAVMSILIVVQVTRETDQGKSQATMTPRRTKPSIASTG